jgi:hypothetical protein
LPQYEIIIRLDVTVFVEIFIVGGYLFALKYREYPPTMEYPPTNYGYILLVWKHYKIV